MIPQEVLFLQVGKRRYQISSFEEASTKVCIARDASPHGASRFKSPLLVNESGRVVGHISYNGRVWAGLPQDWKAGQCPISDNR